MARAVHVLFPPRFGLLNLHEIPAAPMRARHRDRRVRPGRAPASRQRCEVVVDEIRHAWIVTDSEVGEQPRLHGISP